MSTEKRAVTQEDLDKDASLAEAGVKVGDEREFEVAEAPAEEAAAEAPAEEAPAEEKKEETAE